MSAIHNAPVLFKDNKLPNPQNKIMTKSAVTKALMQRTKAHIYSRLGEMMFLIVEMVLFELENRLLVVY